MARAVIFSSFKSWHITPSHKGVYHKLLPQVMYSNRKVKVSVYFPLLIIFQKIKWILSHLLKVPHDFLLEHHHRGLGSPKVGHLPSIWGGPGFDP